MIDASGLAEDLEQAGFPRDQAHGLARAPRDRTVEDLAAKHDLRELELRLEARPSQIEQKIANAQTAMIKWFTGVMIAQAAAVVALIKLLPGRPVIDTLALAERLEREYGDDPERARRHARILGDMLEAGDVATKRDIQELRTELRTELREVEERLCAELHKEIGSIAWKMAGLLLAQGAAIVALIKLLPGG